MDLDSIPLRQDFLHRLLLPQGSPNAISAHELELLSQRENLRRVDGMVEGGLVSLVQRLQPGVEPLHVVLYLLDCLATGDPHLLEDAIMALVEAARERRTLSANDLMTAFREGNNGVSPGLMLALLGEDAPESPPVPTRPFSGLNLDAMRDFR